MLDGGLHGGQPLRPAAADQPHQDCFRLVVLMVGQQQGVRLGCAVHPFQGFVAHFPGPCFRAATGGHMDGGGAERYAQPPAQVTDEALVPQGCFPQVVADMGGGDLKAPLPQGAGAEQQAHRIGPAGNGHQQPRPGMGFFQGVFREPDQALPSILRHFVPPKAAIPAVQTSIKDSRLLCKPEERNLPENKNWRTVQYGLAYREVSLYNAVAFP